MPIITNFSHNYPEDPVFYYGFEKFDHLFPNVNLYFGAEIPESIKTPTTNKKVLFATEEQIDDNNLNHSVAGLSLLEDHADVILSISPLCYKRDDLEKYNNGLKRPKRHYVFQPFNDEFEPKDKSKLWDVIYTGGDSVRHALDIVNVIKKFFMHRYVSFRGPFATNINVSYKEKLQLIANSRINIIHNIVSDNIPQLKTRPFESAFCKTLMVCRYDKFKTIEKWFTPDEDFIYYNNESDLEQIISDVLENYDNYQFMIENAYNKAKKEYTTEQFVKKYLINENTICD
jgi:hypothetical protein